MFADPSLSASGRLACASCHSPERAFGPPNALAVQLGGDMRQPGLRAVPSLRYLQATPPFTEHFFESEDEADESVDNGPTGGLTWDGRVDRGAEQARIPLLSPFEMANASPHEVVRRALEAGYGEALRAIFGDAVLADEERTFDGILKAFEVFEQDWRTFYPYTSKYDAYLAGKATLTAQERRGLDLFEDPDKGNCAACHISRRGLDGTPPQFTDFGLIALGRPAQSRHPGQRRSALVRPRPVRPAARPTSAAARTIAACSARPRCATSRTRQTFFHNGVVPLAARRRSRSTPSATPTPSAGTRKDADGTVRKFDDLPPEYRANVNTDPPFGRQPGEPPALTDAEIDDIVAFLGTLTDGYVVGTD